MGPHDEELERLRRDNRVLRTKLRRSEQNQARLEEYKERADTFHRSLLQESRANEERLRSSERRAQAANEAKSRFLATMSHELRTPLNAVIAYGDLLAEDPELAQLEEVLADVDQIRAAGRHLLSLIEEVLDLARIESGHLELNREVLSVAALLDEAARTVRPLATKGGNELVCELPEPQLAVFVDSTRLRQVLLNLLGNACKFTSNGLIRVEGRRCGSRVELEVSDTGPGIPADKLDQVFEPFFMADDGLTRTIEGSGLGLSVAAQLCELMGAEVRVHSVEGLGSTFVVSVPEHPR